MIFLTDDPTCPNCLHKCEDNIHFFFGCLTYDHIREVHMVNLSRLDTVINLDLLLSGDANLCSCGKGSSIY